jgi:hypothetical protein
MPILARILASLVGAASLCAAGCSVYAGGGGGGGGGGGDLPPIPTGPPSDVEQQLQALLQATYPGGTIVAGPGTDTSVTLATPPGDPLQRAPVPLGAPLGIALDYTSQQPVTGVCVGFGSPNNAYCVPVGTPGVLVSGSATQGVAALALPVPTELCAMLSSICHDIRCYEFAQTSAGTFSKANINLLAAACGGCDEPSCQELLDMCVDDCTVSGCPAGEICIEGVCQTQTQQNSCALRVPSCCPGQDDSCTAPDAECFCDDHCTEAGDCCPDVCAKCGYCN